MVRGRKKKPDGATVDQGGAGVCYRKEGNVIVDATSPQRTKAVRTMRNSVTMQKILDYCDASEISVRHWTERVKSVHPSNTRKIETGHAIHVYRAGNFNHAIRWTAGEK